MYFKSYKDIIIILECYIYLYLFLLNNVFKFFLKCKIVEEFDFLFLVEAFFLLVLI